MSLFLKKNTAAFFLLVGLNLLVAFAASFVLPKRFYYDAAIIAYDKGNEIGYFGSYPLTILFYKITGLRYLPFTLIASPKVQKITSGRRAISIHTSIRPIGNTHTGQPGP